jgi:hypothetical protein
MGLSLLHVEQVSAYSVAWSRWMGICLLERSCRLIWLIREACSGLFSRWLRELRIKKTPVLKRKELYQGLIEPGWGAGLLNPAQGGERNILYMTPLMLNSFLY